MLKPNKPVRRILPFGTKWKRSPIVARLVNELVAACNAALNISIRRGARDDVIYGDEAIVIQLARSSETSGETTGAMVFRGDYDPDGVYLTQHVVVIRSGANKGTFVCVTDNPGSTNPPTQPDTGNAYWVSLSNGDTIGNWL